MLTPKLEELILCGKAFFKTAVVGGSKSTINIQNDRFAIITDITFLPYVDVTDLPDSEINCNTQLSIYGERGFNHYIFANQRAYAQAYFDTVNGERTVNRRMPLSPQKIDCYLLHTTQVGFSFLVTNFVIPSSTTGIASFNNPGYAPPLDYGKDGITGSINVNTDITPNTSNGFLNQIVNRGSGLGIGSEISQQIQYPADITALPVINSNPQFPIANINYVEILGQPGNIGI